MSSTRKRTTRTEQQRTEDDADGGKPEANGEINDQILASLPTRRETSESVGLRFNNNVGSHMYLSGSDNDRGNSGNFVQASVDDNRRGSNAKLERSVEVDD